MATKIATGAQATVVGGASITTNSPSATAGNTLVLQISWANTGAVGSESLTAPTGWSVGRNPAATSNLGGGVGEVGLALFYKTAAGGVESPVINAPSGTTSFYANAIITEWSGMGAHDTADSPAFNSNTSAASTTGVTVTSTNTLSAANSTVFTCVSILAGTGLANAGIAFSGGSWATEASDQNTSTSVGSLFGDKAVAGTTAVNAVYTWTSDSTMLGYQAHVVVFSDAAGAATVIVDTSEIVFADGAPVVAGQDALEDWFANVAPFAATSRSAAGSLDVAIQLARQATASIDLAVQAPRSTSAAIDLAAQAAGNVIAALDIAVQVAGALTTSLQVAVQTSPAASTSLDLAVQAARNATASLDAALQVARAATASIDLSVQAPTSATASLDLQVQAGTSLAAALQLAVLATANAGSAVDLAVQRPLNATAALGLAAQQALSAAATLDIAVQAARSAGASIDLQVQLGTSVAAALSAAVQASAAAQTQLGLAVQDAHTAAAVIDLTLAVPRSAAAQIDFQVQGSARTAAALLDGAVLSSIAVSAGLSILIEDPSAYIADSRAHLGSTTARGVDARIGSKRP